MNIEKVSLAVQIEGKAYFVALDSDRLRLLVQMAQGLSDNGRINVIPAPEGFEFRQIKDLKRDELVFKTYEEAQEAAFDAQFI